jgi:hypothetical protein
VPDFGTVSVYRVCVVCVNVAVTALLPLIVTLTGLDEPLRSPLQPLNTQPDEGVAASWTVDPEAYDDWLGLLETAPWPTVVTVTVYWVCAAWVKVAVTALLPFMVTVAGFAEPVREPPQPVKPEPAAGLAVRVTTVPDA